MSTLTHQQFNSPMALYSKENVDDVYQKSLAALNPKQNQLPSPVHTETYRLLHGNEKLPPQHSVRYEEPKRDDYPHYQGFVDPNLQSPSFRRLQHMTGVGADDGQVLSGSSVTVHQDDRERLSGLQARPVPPPPPPPPPSQLAPPRQQPPAIHQKQQHTAVYSYEPGVKDEMYGQQVMSESLARKLAEAERPKVAPTPIPFWARAAEQKHEKWQDRSERQQSYDQSCRSSVPLSRSSTLPRSTTPFSGVEQKNRYHVAEWPRSSNTESWLKVCVAPNLDQLDRAGLKYNTWRSGSSGGRRSVDYSYRASESLPRKQVSISSLVSGQAVRPVGSVVTAPPWRQTAETKHSKWQQQMDRLDPNFQPKVVDLQQQPSWATRAEQKQYTWQRQGDTFDPYSSRPRIVSEQPPSWTKQAERTQKLWKSEADAWNERRQQQGVEAQPPWRQNVADKGKGGGGGGTTEAFSAGTFFDEQGQKVNYSKEIYSTVDPGNEYSVRKERHETASEGPVQPGAPIKRTVQKYYKKTTHTTTTTKGAALPHQSALSSAPLNYYSSCAPIKPGSISAHESQF